jgi:hypothetical protein
MRALQRLLADYGFMLHATGHPAKYFRADHALSFLRYKAGNPDRAHPVGPVGGRDSARHETALRRDYVSPGPCSGRPRRRGLRKASGIGPQRENDKNLFANGGIAEAGAACIIRDPPGVRHLDNGSSYPID